MKILEKILAGIDRILYKMKFCPMTCRYRHPLFIYPQSDDSRNYYLCTKYNKRLKNLGSLQVRFDGCTGHMD